MASLQALTALGAREPAVVEIGPLRITERTDLALASVAARRGRMADIASAAKAAGVPLPDAARYLADAPYSTFWTAPEMWFVEAGFGSHELIADQLKAIFGDAASITEQTDAWVVFDLAATDIAPLLERLCNVDFRSVPKGYATRTVMEHLGVYLVKLDGGAVRLYGPRSSAQSLLHALEAAAASAW